LSHLAKAFIQSDLRMINITSKSKVISFIKLFIITLVH